MKVPFVDLAAQYSTYKSDIDAAIAAVIKETAFVRGRFVDEFENSFSDGLGGVLCVSCANGTDSLLLTLKAWGVGPGDEVITAANSWISSSEVIGWLGAQAVFVDSDEYFGIDVNLLEAKITSRTKAIIPVHLYGQPADMDVVMSLAKKYGLKVLEDCAQAHFAKYKGRYVGTIGDAGSFSFYPGKNLGAYGDAGCVVTRDSELANSIRRYANHGALVKHEHEVEGCNSRLDGLQAAILSAKLPHIHDWSRARQQHAAAYAERLKYIEQISLPLLREGCEHVYHVYCVLAEQRGDLQQHLSKRGISTAIHYPTPLPLLPAYRHVAFSVSDYPRAVSESPKLLSLPMFPELTETQIEYVTSAIREFYA